MEKITRRAVPASVELPEGFYRCVVELYRTERRRRLWPFPVALECAEITIPNGVPVPGDRIYSMVTTGLTAGEAVEALRCEVLRRRGAEDWAPAAGWPTHCMVR